jgi:hypothetical protein
LRAHSLSEFSSSSPGEHVTEIELGSAREVINFQQRVQTVLVGVNLQIPLGRPVVAVQKTVI